MTQERRLSRRSVLRLGLAAVAGVILAWPGPSGASLGADAPAEICVTLSNHWSYTGIGWSSGLKTCAQSITDCLAMADYTPGVKSCINLDALAYAMVAQSNPEVVQRLKQYLKEGKVEIVGGTYGQPMGSMVSGESNIRQLVIGQQTIQKSLGVLVSSFLEEEEFTHPQLPQLLKGAGYRFASTAQCDTWGKHGSPPMDRNVFNWRGLDGTCILATPINGLVFHPPCVTHDIDWLWSDAGRKRVQELQRLGMPLAIKWTEFGWGPNELEGKTANQFYATKFRTLSEKYRVRYTTLTEYLQEYGGQAKEPITWRMDDFRKLQPWGVGGDQLRREGREVEALLSAAERFGAAACLLGLEEARAGELEEAWKHLLIAQSHDVSMCEYLPGVGDPEAQKFISATGTASENSSVNTWGTLGFRHMEVAKKTARRALDASLRSVSAAVDTAMASHGETAIIVFNSCGSARDAVASTGRLQFKDAAGAGVVVRDAQGQTVPSQLLTAERNPSGELLAADVGFLARQVPSLGYATYYIERTKSGAAPPDGALRTSQSGFHMENEYVSVELDPANGAIARLTDRRQGQEMIDGRHCPFPVLSGRRNPKHPAAKDAPDRYDSQQSKAQIAWVERGPVRAVVKAVHVWPQVRMEHWVTLQAGQPLVESRVRLLADVPPACDEGKINGWQFPLDIVEGYWLAMAPAFKPTAVLRDYPFGIEETKKDAIDALAFIDLVGPQGGLLVVHSGTQYFKRTDDGVFSNLAIREWHSHFTGAYGWPRVAEYRYALVPHAAEFTNADRLRSVEAFDQPLLCVIEPLHPGRLAKQRSFASVDSRDVLLSSLRALCDGACEVRVIEQDGRTAAARVKLDVPASRFAPCDFLGRTSGDYRPLDNGEAAVSLAPWQVRTFRLER